MEVPLGRPAQLGGTEYDDENWLGRHRGNRPGPHFDELPGALTGGKREMACEEGTLGHPEVLSIVALHNGRLSETILVDGRQQFIDAYDEELQDFVVLSPEPVNKWTYGLG